MVQIPQLSMVQLTFLCDHYGLAIEGFEDVIGASLERQLETPQWKAELSRRFSECEEQVGQLGVESAELSRAVGDALGGPHIIKDWRRDMEKVCDHIRDPEMRKRTKKAIGWGLGSPASIKEAKAFLIAVDGGARGYEQALLKHGAEPEDIAFPSAALRRLKEATAQVMKEEADVTNVRRSTRDACARAREAIEMVTLAAEFAKSRAVRRGDKAKESRADALLALLQSAINQSDIQARTRAETENLPEELVTPLPSDGGAEDNGGNNHGN